MAIEEDPPPLHIAAVESGNLIGVISCGITGHATLHVPILVGPILRVEKEGPIT